MPSDRCPPVVPTIRRSATLTPQCFGIRMALGAERGRVVALVLRDAAALAAVGLAVGLVAALALTRVLRTMLFEVTTTDLLTYVAMALTLAAAVLAASWFPARRAARVDPVIALRKGYPARLVYTSIR